MLITSYGVRSASTTSYGYPRGWTLYGYNDNQTPNEPGQPGSDQQPDKPKKKNQTPEEYKALGQQLSSYFGTPVKLACSAAGKGKITIPFASNEELEHIMEILDSARQRKADA